MAWKNPWYNPELPHHLEKGFCNPGASLNSKIMLRRWRAERRKQGLPKPPAMGYPAFIRQWWQQTHFNEGQGDGLWWLGHATLLLSVNGRFLLTDPVFSRRASPLTFYGPQRKTPLPFLPDELPAIDAVLISHNHYDHLDRATIRYLYRRFPDIQFFVPLGLQPWFFRQGITAVSQLDWWQHICWQGLNLHCVPAQHWSMRGLWDRNRSLWCGWVVESVHMRFWFSGDTGYSEQLIQIPQRLGRLTAATIPIGAYAPRWFMGQNHMDPQQAVQLWQQFSCPLAIPVHWGVFELADESLDMPVAELQEGLAQQGEAKGNFIPLKIGGYLPLTKNESVQPA